MPITPFHFGPGLLCKGLAPKHVSWTSFALANCLIDLEPISLYLLTGSPDHRFFHTFPGATLAAIVAATLGKGFCEAWLRFWNRQLSPAQAKWLGTDTQIGRRSIWLGALLGAWSHLWLDAYMHIDVTPGWPLWTNNPLHSMITLEFLHWSCLVAGIAGLALLGIRRLHKHLASSKKH